MSKDERIENLEAALLAVAEFLACPRDNHGVGSLLLFGRQVADAEDLEYTVRTVLHLQSTRLTCAAYRRIHG